MDNLRYTLLSDGSSDDALIPVLTWLLQQRGVNRAIQATWADLRRLPTPPQTLVDRIRWSLDLYPYDLLFIHRDAETLPRSARVAEIRAALIDASAAMPVPPICVIPVRMQEAWFLLDEMALRYAAGNPAGQQPLELPRVSQIEQLPDPKTLLYQLLRDASGLRGRRRKRLEVRKLVHRVAEFMEDFTPLRALPAFAALERDIEGVVESQRWGANPEALATRRRHSAS
jgi:hypothetical protein